ncbi:MAG: tRNA 2-thiouridine(34) synthase MnmA [Clostridia bacterium]|nr:tRNA 2-thiouridine(34) synthase MnmA [Clostridia bacterium]
MKKVLVGMSGGVDSSACALILKEMGFSVTGLTLSLCEKDNDRDISDAKSVCEKLHIEHLNIDLSDDFKQKVVAPFINEYKQGLTPNPCLECNKYIKFGKMLDIALDKGFDKIATGHYARVEKQGDRYVLKKAKDLSKDQSYVLYSLTQHQLKHLLLPLGDLTKSDIREKAENAGLVNANRPDSQDICFVPDGDYAAFIQRTDGFVSEAGDYVDINGNVLGKHEGVIHYTIGQRKGLKIALGKPQFVINKNAEKNTVILGDEEHLFKKEVLVSDVNFIPFDTLEKEMRVKAKLRYRHTEQPATIYPLENRQVKIVFDEPQRAPSAGQAAVFYDGDTLVGGGKIIDI